MKKSLITTSLVAIALIALVVSAQYFDVIGFIKRMHGG